MEAEEYRRERYNSLTQVLLASPTLDFFLFQEERAGPVEFRDISPPLLPSSVPPPNSNTVNHRTTIHKVYSKIVSALTVVDSPRLISLTGQAGIGKTQIALFALRYLRERAHRFNLAAVYNADLLGHVGGSGRRRKHRCKETFEDIIRSAINPRATSFAQAVSEVTQVRRSATKGVAACRWPPNFPRYSILTHLRQSRRD